MANGQKTTFIRVKNHYIKIGDHTVPLGRKRTLFATDLRCYRPQPMLSRLTTYAVEAHNLCLCCPHPKFLLVENCACFPPILCSV